MKFTYNNPLLKDRRKKLRTKSTPEEIIIWNWIKNKKLGVKFRRQFSIGNFITDFCCTDLRFIIELDGIQHTYNHEYDTERDNFLRSKDYFILRLPNSLIHHNLLQAVEIIQEHVYLLSENKHLRISSPEKGRWP